ncbi:hypothetical protein IFM89_006712 [Coptis chinensis]|uniref:Kin17 KOW domain-containing protein n=1 Tax=Coptis chinensis TaxID=261450 RepID=A0A835H9V0_9MAGN|nr:hypothetical protein IFM89_006712 [Coptis chinensis]
MRKGLDNNGYYYKQRRLVVNVIDMYLVEIEMLESKDVIRARQAELETVIPHNGGLVKIVNGKRVYRGSNARLISLDMDEFYAKVQIETGLYDGRVLEVVSFEDICMLVQ